ncbi:excalibur calcium-binding domain-containing protein [Cytobacillus sp. FSL R5-0377]|uniref:excalibur calcium-binding domain-containing protein n=1 Tax=Cytobacillus sp. FSL R5-0377 TaxID=2954543 RepID=UPI004046D2A5
MTLCLLASLSFSPAAAAKTAKIKTYKNCTELNKDYKGGVARTAGIKNKGGKTKYKPYISAKLYDANKSKDRDKDKIACER